MKIDRIEVIRGGKLFYKTMPNGDRLDSIAEFYSGPVLVTKSEDVNTDPTEGWAGKKGGILAESNLQPLPLRFICDYRADNGKKVLFIYKATNERNNCIVTARDLTKEDRTLVSLIPNAAQGMKNLIDAVLFHSIGVTTDGSHGCLTADGWRAIMAYFEIGDKGLLNLTRAQGWDAPDEYRQAGRIA